MFTVGQKLKTRGGMSVEILAVLPEPDQFEMSVVGLMIDGEGTREIMTWCADGAFRPNGTQSGLDLVDRTLRLVSAEVQFS